jgi:hypothetical protein
MWERGGKEVSRSCLDRELNGGLVRLWVFRVRLAAFRSSPHLSRLFGKLKIYWVGCLEHLCEEMFEEFVENEHSC